MRQNSHVDDLYATRLLQDYEDTLPRPIRWGVALTWWAIIALLALFWTWALSPMIALVFQ